ncbi:[4Fe-4S] proteins maturation [Malassezia sp. CBS 17886]|nr:[4Fe-4S] proteins maturation [Malassezia sp. CBS 17886]
MTQKLHTIAEAENDPSVGLRVTVEPGGCHGYVYKLDVIHGSEEDDFVFMDGDARVVVDSISLALINGCTIDYVTELIGSQFAIRENPQAKGSGWEPVL